MPRSYRVIDLSDLLDAMPDAPADLVAGAVRKAEAMLQTRWGGRVSMRLDAPAFIAVHDISRVNTLVGTYIVRECMGEIVCAWDDEDYSMMTAGPADEDALAAALADIELDDNYNDDWRDALPHDTERA